MEENEPTKVSVNTDEIILKSNVDRNNFCQKTNWLRSEESDYDTNFFKNINGRKKWIIIKMLNNSVYTLYMPDNIDIEKLSKEF